MGAERKMTERDRYTGDYDSVEAPGAAPGIGPCILAPQLLTAAGSPYYTPTVDMGAGVAGDLTGVYEKCLFDILGGAADMQDTTLAIRVLQSDTAQPLQAIAVNAKVLAGAAGAKFISDSALGDYSYGGYYYYKMNRKWLIEVDVEEMDVNNGFRYLQLEFTVATGGGGAGEWLLAAEAIRSMASHEATPQTHADQVVA